MTERAASADSAASSPRSSRTDGVDAAGQLPQLGDGRLGRGVRLGDQRLRGLRVGVDLLLREAERHADRDQPRLDAVVQVALDAGALDVGGADGAGALDARGAGGLGELRLTRGHHDGAGEDAVQEARPTIGGDGEERGEDADGHRPGDGTSMPVRASVTALASAYSGAKASATPSREAERGRRRSSRGRSRSRALATARHTAGSMDWRQIVRSNPPNPGGRCGRSRRAGGRSRTVRRRAPSRASRGRTGRRRSATRNSEADAEDREEAESEAEEGEQDREDDGADDPERGELRDRAGHAPGREEGRGTQGVAAAAAGCVRVWEVMPPRYGRRSRSAPRSSRHLVSGYPESGSVHRP